MASAAFFNQTIDRSYALIYVDIRVHNLQRFNTRSVFDHDHKEQPDKENPEESEGLLTSFDSKIPEDLYEQLEQEQMIENQEKAPSEDPGSNPDLFPIVNTIFIFVLHSHLR